MLLIVGQGGGWYVHRLEKTTSDLVAQDVRSIRPAERLVLATDDLRLQLSRYLATSDRANLDGVADHIAAIDAALTWPGIRQQAIAKGN